MFKFRNFIFILFCLSFVFNAKATHNRAGEITYKWIGPGLYTYKIKITTYTNIGQPNLADRCFDTLYFGDGTSGVIARSNGNCTSSAACYSEGACDGFPITGNIKLNEYTTTHTYPGPGNYRMSMEDPNRNGGVINIPNSIGQVFYIESYLVIPQFGSSQNNSPVFSFPPIDNGCLSQCFYHNPGAIDMDGDSLSYELTMCRGAGGLVCPAFNYPDSGGGIFKIDSLTGTLTWCNPQLQGEYNMAMIIKEWRLDGDGNYFLVGSVLRDMQVSVGMCINVPPMILINNLDTCIVGNSSINQSIMASDADQDLISLSANGGPFKFITNPASFNTTSSISPATGVFNWNTNYSQIRRLPYQITIKASDNKQQMTLVNFNTFTIKVIPHAPINLNLTPANNYIQLKWNKPLYYSTTGLNPFNKYRVYRKIGVSNWVATKNETAPPAYTGFKYIGYTNNTIADTSFFDFNSGLAFNSLQDYSYVVIAEYADGSTSRISNIATSQIYVGLKELSLNNNSITISPNPIIENFSINFNTLLNNAYTITLFDITGRKIKSFLNNELIVNQNSIQLKLENINQGIYFIKISDGKQTITKKIIKQ